MPIASALVVSAPDIPPDRVITFINNMNGVVSCLAGPKGIAVVFETADMRELKKITTAINAQEEVMDVQLAYLNWEDLDEL